MYGKRRNYQKIIAYHVLGDELPAVLVNYTSCDLKRSVKEGVENTAAVFFNVKLYVTVSVCDAAILKPEVPPTVNAISAVPPLTE